MQDDIAAIQQQVANIRPWTMCSMGEARDRAKQLEISSFECVHTHPVADDVAPHVKKAPALSSLQRLLDQQAETKNRNRTSRNKQSDVQRRNNAFKTRQGDACLMVQKYRRSAAGTLRVQYDGKHRSIPDLVTTVNYLLFHVFTNRCAHKSTQEPQNLCTVVEFVNDRLRAVQVDLSSHRYLNGSKQVTILLARMVRYYIIVSYLLCELKAPKFDSKLHSQQLEACISLFRLNLASFCNHNDWRDCIALVDEVLSYSCILSACSGEMRQSALSIELSDLISSLQTIARLGNNGDENNSRINVFGLFPRMKSTIDLLLAIERNDYIQVLHKILSSGDRWSVLARCCFVPMLDEFRSNVLEVWNKSWMKGQRVTDKEVSGLRIF